MRTVSKMTGIGVAAVLLLTGIATSAKGLEVPKGESSFAGGPRGMTQIIGSVICIDCSLDEARAAQPDENRLYKLMHHQGQVVMTVRWVNHSSGWRTQAPAKIWVQAEDELFQKLTAEEHLFQEVKITGLLSEAATLDIRSVAILAPSPIELARATANEAEH